MAVSDVAICNLALQKLGAARITALTEDSASARACNAAYEFVRDRELRLHPWGFARVRATLAPSATAPDFEFDYAFPLPSDYLRLLPPGRYPLDWRIERHDGRRCVLTNDGDTLEIEYIARVEDPAQYDSLFVEALACALAAHLAEELTQSNAKKEHAAAEYRSAMAEARKVNAFENVSADPPEDPWLAARR